MAAAAGATAIGRCDPHPPEERHRLHGQLRNEREAKRQRRFPSSQADRQDHAKERKANETWQNAAKEGGDGMRSTLSMSKGGNYRGCDRAIVTEHSMGGNHLTRALDQICYQRGRPAVIRSDNGPEFTGKAVTIPENSKAVRY